MPDIIMQTGDAVIITTPEGIIEYIIPAFERITAYTHTEMPGHKIDLVKSGWYDKAFFIPSLETSEGGESFQGVFIKLQEKR